MSKMDEELSSLLFFLVAGRLMQGEREEGFVCKNFGRKNEIVALGGVQKSQLLLVARAGFVSVFSRVCFTCALNL